MHVLACIRRLNTYLNGYTNIILESCEQISVKIKSKYNNKFHTRKLNRKCLRQNGGRFGSASMCFTMIDMYVYSLEEVPKSVMVSGHMSFILSQPGPLLLTWIYFNPNKNKYSPHYRVWSEITYPFPNFYGAAVDVWEWISYFIPHFTGYVFTCPCWDYG